MKAKRVIQVIRERGDDKNDAVRVLLFDAAARLDSVDAGHFDVEKEDVRRFLRRKERFTAFKGAQLRCRKLVLRKEPLQKAG